MKKIIIVAMLLAISSLSFADDPPIPPTGPGSTNSVPAVVYNYCHYTLHLNYTTEYGSGTQTYRSYNKPIRDVPTFAFWTLQNVTINGVPTYRFIAVESTTIGKYDYFGGSIILKAVNVDPSWVTVSMTVDPIEFSVDPI